MKKYNVEHTSIDEKLMSCVMNGVAFHHAGLSSSQRKTVETEFKNGFIKCIVATPTLAAGVNIPAQRVIVRDLWRYDFGFGMKPIPVLEYKQQAGRAGRPRFDSFGEAITIAKNDRQKNQILNNYIHGDVEPIYSKLGNKSALRMHLLAAIATGFVKSMQDIFTFIDSTFYAYQAETYSLKTQIDETIDFLIENDFITSENDVITPTILGQRTSSLYIDPMSAVRLKKAIEASNTKQTSELSILQIICSTPDVRSLYLKKTDGWVEQIADSIRDEFLIQVPNAYEEEYEWFLSDLKTALLVNDWIEEKTENDLINKYGVGPGDIHSIVESSGWMIYATREIARMYNFNLLSFLSDMLIRTRNGCKKELLNLISLKGIGRIRARSLFNAGFKSINDLRKVPIHSIAEVKTIGPRIAENIKKQIGENQKFSEKQYL
jgi:helicase